MHEQHSNQPDPGDFQTVIPFPAEACFIRYSLDGPIPVTGSAVLKETPVRIHSGNPNIDNNEGSITIPTFEKGVYLITKEPFPTVNYCNTHTDFKDIFPTPAVQSQEYFNEHHQSQNQRFYIAPIMSPLFYELIKTTEEEHSQREDLIDGIQISQPVVTFNTDTGLDVSFVGVTHFTLDADGFHPNPEVMEVPEAEEAGKWIGDNPPYRTNLKEPPYYIEFVPCLLDIFQKPEEGKKQQVKFVSGVAFSSNNWTEVYEELYALAQGKVLDEESIRSIINPYVGCKVVEDDIF